MAVCEGQVMAFVRYLVRHGSTVLSGQSRIVGRADPPLDEKGLTEAEAAASAVAALELPNCGHIIFTSPLRRASRTAHFVARLLDCRVVEHDGFLDRDWGEWTGRRSIDLDPEELEVTPPGGESSVLFQQRVLAAWNELPTNANVILVGHAEVFQSILRHLVTRAPDIPSGGVVRVLSDAVGWRVCGPILLRDALDTESDLPSATYLFASEKHRRQSRASGAPYIEHLERVARRLHSAGFQDETIISGALLHDTLEDTDTTQLELEHHFGREVTALVVSLTLKPNVPFEEQAPAYYNRIVKAGPPSVAIKLADIADNLTDIEAISPWRSQRMAKRAREFLHVANHAADLPLLDPGLLFLKAQLAKAIVNVEDRG